MTYPTHTNPTVMMSSDIIPAAHNWIGHLTKHDTHTALVHQLMTLSLLTLLRYNQPSIIIPLIHELMVVLHAYATCCSQSLHTHMSLQVTAMHAGIPRSLYLYALVHPCTPSVLHSVAHCGFSSASQLFPVVQLYPLVVSFT